MYCIRSHLDFVFLDFDGTLIDSETIHKQIWCDICSVFEVEPPVDFSAYHGLPASQIAARLFADPDHATQALCLFESQELERDYNWNPGAYDFVKYMSSIEVPLAIVTNSRLQKVLKFLNNNKVYDLFRFIISCEQFLERKPHPEAYLLALSKSKCIKERVIAVEDSRSGATSAYAAGLNYCIVQPSNGYHFNDWIDAILQTITCSYYEQTEIASNTLWAFHNRPEALDHSDVIIGLGSYDNSVPLECVRLWKMGLGSYILFTGKSGNWTTGWKDSTEAQRFRSVALDEGVPASSIILENEATNIGENIRFSRDIMRDRHWRKSIVVTKPQTILRARLTIDALRFDESFLVTSAASSKIQYVSRFGRHQLYNEMVGDLDRIIQYPSRGFMERVDIPDKVMLAYETLKLAGFVSHLLK